MKRIKSTIAFLIFASLLQAAPAFVPGAAVYIKASAPVEGIKTADGVRLGNGTWMKKNKDFGVSAVSAVSDEWKTLKFAFKPSADGEVEIILRSRFFRDADGKVSDNRVLFDRVKIGGKDFPFDIDSDSGRWKKYGKAAFAYKDGGRVAIVSYQDMVSRKVGVRAGETVEVSARVRDCGAPEDVFLDLGAFANLPVSGGSNKIGGEYVALGNFKTGKVRFNGLDFNIADPEKNGGNSVAALSSLQAPGLGKMELDFTGRRVMAKFLYILHSSGKNIRKVNKMKNVGLIKIEYADGFVDSFWIKRETEALSAYSRKIGDNALPVYVEDGKKKTGTVYMSRYGLENKFIKRVSFYGLDYTAWNIFGATLSDKNVLTTGYFKFPKDEWRPVDLSDLEIKSGSALDVSAGMGHAPAGKYGRLKVSENGKFVFEGAPGKEVKFKGTNWRPGDQFFRIIKSKEDIDVLAKMARKQGYNMVRWRLSMKGAKEFAAPYEMLPEVLDMYDYFLYAMGREGVYTHLNLSSHDLGDPSFEWDDRYDVKMKMLLGDSETRQAWRKLVNMQLNHVNPYTGKKWKDDPAIATTEYFNEMELGYTTMRISPEVADYANREFRAWLKKKYGTVEKLNEAWTAEGYKANYGTFDAVKVFGKSKYRSLCDRSLFIIEKGKEFLAYCEKAVRGEEKFMAPVHQFNCGRCLDTEFLSAWGGSYMAMNVYFAHPTEFNAVDSSTPQESSLDINEALGYFRGASSKRMADRPMALTEWQHCHWSPYKHEAGVTFPALAALQGFDNLTVHDYAIEKRGVGIFGHAEVSKSPVMRANEFLSYCFFYRGDVKRSPHRVDVVFDGGFVGGDRGIAHQINSEQSKISLITGFAIDFPGARKIADIENVKVKPADISLKPAASERLHPSKGEGFDLDAFVSVLRGRGILKSDNITKPSEGVFQSDTGEIVLRMKERLARVVTANSEAVALKPETKGEKLGILTVNSTSVPAAVAVASVDGRPLAESSRMVFIYSTDTIATDFKVSASRRILKSRGKPPILVQVGKLSAEVRLPKPSAGGEPSYSLYALKLTGERAQKIPAKISGGTMHVQIDTSKLEKEPAVFYEIAAD